jgi:hypothetical protein
VSFSVEWPKAFSDLVGFFNLINLDFFQVVDIQCINSDLTFYSTFVGTIMMPIIVSCLIFFGLWVRLNYFHEEEATLELNRISLDGKWTLHIKIWVFFVFLVYPSVSATITTLFNCKTVNGVPYMTVDVRNQCTGDEFAGYAVLAVMGILLYILGIPAFFAVMLYSNKAQLFPDAALATEKYEVKQRLQEFAIQAVGLQSSMNDLDPESKEFSHLSELKAFADYECKTAGAHYERLLEQTYQHELFTARFGFIYASYAGPGPDCFK